MDVYLTPPNRRFVPPPLTLGGDRHSPSLLIPVRLIVAGEVYLCLHGHPFLFKGEWSREYKLVGVKGKSIQGLAGCDCSRVISCDQVQIALRFIIYDLLLSSPNFFITARSLT